MCLRNGGLRNATRGLLFLTLTVLKEKKKPTKHTTAALLRVTNILYQCLEQLRKSVGFVGFFPSLMARASCLLSRSLQNQFLTVHPPASHN